MGRKLKPYQILLIILGVLLFVGIIQNQMEKEESEGVSSSKPASEETTETTATAVKQEKEDPHAKEKKKFDGDPGIEATAEMYSNSIGSPCVRINVKNTSGKNISAIKFYSVPYNVYGEEITGWTTQNRLYTDDKIKSGKTKKISYSFIEDKIKIVKLYVYSVYFEDGTEWGDKDASSYYAIKYGKRIEVEPED